MSVDFYYYYNRNKMNRKEKIGMDKFLASAFMLKAEACFFLLKVKSVGFFLVFQEILL